MQQSNVPLLFRDDTFLGVCQGLGEDFRFNPNYLRVLLGALLLWNPEYVLGAYLVLGAVVLLSRVVFPNRKGTKAADTRTEPLPSRPASAQVREEVPAEELAIAA